MDDDVDGTAPTPAAGGVRLTPDSRARMAAFCSSHQTQVLTILLSDLEGSTSQQDRLGNVRAAELVREHRRVFRDTLSRFDGLEVETAGDSFLTVFAAPSEGVKFALHMRAAMRAAREQHPELPRVRVGIHQGQVVVERHEDGPKALDIYGLQVSTAARIMGLGRGGQVLCSRAVFDDARAILRGDALEGLGALTWCNHGPYRFKGVADSHEVCEVCEAGAAAPEAPAATAKGWPADEAAEELGWRPAVGGSVPGTNWVLEERLGRQEPAGRAAPRYRGEFGEVWRAWNPGDKSRQAFKFCFRRDRVPALKREARLLKRLRRYRHPSLVEVYDVTEGDRPPYYLEMEYVDGPTLEAWLAEDPPLAERLEVVAQVADALDTVHAARIYHRDIKPSNILLTRREDGSLRAKLTDFGLGAAEDPELLRSLYASRVEGVAGTWDYLAPEVRSGGRATAQSDLYSLGVALYQVVVGDVRRPLGDWRSHVPSEVLREDIRRCVATEPAERWGGAAELARALRSHDQRLSDRRRERRVNRLRSIAGVAGLLTLVMLALLAYVWYERGIAEQQRDLAERERARARELARIADAASRRAARLAVEAGEQRDTARAERERAVEAKEQSERELYYSKIMLAPLHAGDQQYELARRVLWEAPEAHRNWEWGHRLRRLQADLTLLHFGASEVRFHPDGDALLTRAPEGHARMLDAMTGRARATFGARGLLTAMALSPDGRTVATASWNGTARLWDAESARELHILKGHRAAVQTRAAPGSKVLVTFDDGVQKTFPAGRTGILWELDDFEELDAVQSARFSPDGRRVVTASLDGTARVWDVATGQCQWVLIGEPRRTTDHDSLSSHDALAEWLRRIRLRCAMFSGDGAWTLTIGSHGEAELWHAATGRLAHALGSHRGSDRGTLFSGDSRHVVTAPRDRAVTVWDTRTGKTVDTLPKETVGARSAQFLPGGARVATVDRDERSRVWELRVGSAPQARRFPVAAFDGRIVAVSPAGAAAVASASRGVELFDLATGAQLATLADRGCVVEHAAFDREGTRLAIACPQGPVRVWNVEPHLTPLPARARWNRRLDDVRLSRDGTRLLASAAKGHSTHLYDTATGRQLGSASTPRPPRGSLVVAAWMRGNAARVIVWNGNDRPSRRTAEVWDVVGGRRLATLEGDTGANRVNHVRFSPDGRWIVAGSWTKTAAIWDAATGRIHATLAGHEGSAYQAEFSPDSARVVTVERSTARTWRVATGERLAAFKGAWRTAFRPPFSPDGRAVLLASSDGTARIHEVATGRELCWIQGVHKQLKRAWFSPDGRRVVAASAQGTPAVYDARTGQADHTLEGHDGAVISVGFSPDGTRLVTTGKSSVRVWDASTGRQVEAIRAHGRVPAAAAFTPDGRRLVVAWADAGVTTYRSVPWRVAELPGEGPLTWEQRLLLWKGRRYLRRLERRLLSEADHRDPRKLAAVWRTLKTRCKARYDARDLIPALATAESMLGLAEAWAALEPGSTAARLAVAASHNDLCVAFALLKHHAGARKHAEAGLAIAKTLAKADPQDAQVRRELMMCHDRVGYVLFELGRTDDALDAYRLVAAATKERAAAAPDSDEAQLFLCQSHRHLGRVFLRLKRPAEALEPLRIATAAAKKRLDASPRNASAREQLARCYGVTAEAHRALGRGEAHRDAAEEHVRQLRAIHQLSRTDPKAKSQLADALRKYAEAWVDDDAATRPDVLLARSMAARAAALTGPTDVEALRLLARAHAKAGDLTSAIQTLRTALDHLPTGDRTRQLRADLEAEAATWRAVLEAGDRGP